jgi:hypothetical protein
MNARLLVVGDIGRDRRTRQYYEIPVNVPLQGRLPHWKYFKDGVILEHRDCNTRCFHYTNNKGRPTYIQLSPDFEFRVY